MTFGGLSLSFLGTKDTADDPSRATGTPGTSTRALALPPRTAAEAALHQLPIPLGEGAAALALPLQRLSAIASAANVVRLAARAGRAEGGAARLAELCGQALPDVVALADYQRARAAAAARDVHDTESGNPLVQSAAARAQGAAREGEQAAAWHLEDAHRSLDTLAVAVLETTRAAGRVATAKRAAVAFIAVGDAALLLGWARPVDLEAARERTQAHEPCASDAPAGADARQENPEGCYLSEQAREKRRSDLGWALVRLTKQVSDALGKHKKTLQAAIDRDEKIDDAILNAVIDTVVLAVTAGAGKIGLPALHVATSAATPVATEVTKSSLSVAREVALDVVKKAVLDAAKWPLKNGKIFDEKPLQTDARYQTIGHADALDDAFDRATREVNHDAGQLDDATLEILIVMLESVTPSEIAARIDPIIAAYREQIEPIGDETFSLALPSRRKTVTIPIRVQLPGDQPPRYALALHTSDAAPELRRAGRALVAGARDLGRRVDGSVLGAIDSVRDQTWVNEPEVDIEFVRWIETPAEGGLDLVGLVAEDAIDVAPEKVRGLPLTWALSKP